MGIKFRCPSGHKLNVKSFLSGKRAICPKCGAKVIVPTVAGAVVAGYEPGADVGDGQPSDSSSGLAEEMAGMGGAAVGNGSLDHRPAARGAAGMGAAGMGAADRGGAGAATQGAGSSAGRELGVRTAAVSQNDPIAEAPEATWYVRPPSGGQYGPAPGGLFREWLSEGRVTANSLVWRTGWTEWQLASAVFPRLAVASGLPPAHAVRGTAPQSTTLPTAAAVGGVGPSGTPMRGSFVRVGEELSEDPVVQQRQRRQREKRNMLLASGILFMIVVMLLIALIVVLSRRNAEPESATAPPTPAPTCLV